MITIDYDKCCWKDGKCLSCSCGEETCEGCVEVCPANALQRQNIVTFDPDKCINCNLCIEACKYNAIKNIE